MSRHCNPHCFSCTPIRLGTSGFGRGSLHPGSALSAPHPVACVQTEAERPFQQTYVSQWSGPMHQFSSVALFETQISPAGALINALSDTHFLPVRGIKCISHTVPLRVLFTSQWPISHFLSPRCTGAGEDGQVSFPTRCPAVCARQHQNTAAPRGRMYFSYTQSKRKKEKIRNILI